VGWGVGGGGEDVLSLGKACSGRSTSAGRKQHDSTTLNARPASRDAQRSNSGVDIRTGVRQRVEGGRDLAWNSASSDSDRGDYQDDKWIGATGRGGDKRDVQGERGERGGTLARAHSSDRRDRMRYVAGAGEWLESARFGWNTTGAPFMSDVCGNNDDRGGRDEGVGMRAGMHRSQERSDRVAQNMPQLSGKIRQQTRDAGRSERSKESGEMMAPAEGSLSLDDIEFLLQQLQAAQGLGRYICMCVCVRICICMDFFLDTEVCVGAREVCVCVCACVCVCVCV